MPLGPPDNLARTWRGARYAVPQRVENIAEICDSVGDPPAASDLKLARHLPVDDVQESSQLSCLCDALSLRLAMPCKAHANARSWARIA